MIHVLNKRATTHQDFCEDAYHLEQRGPWVIAAVFDGCSDGIRSHYASQMHAYALRRTIQTSWFLCEQSMSKGFKSQVGVLDDLCAVLCTYAASLREVSGLTILESLSTVVLAIYNTETKSLAVKFLGDGMLYVDGEYERVTSGEDNAPSYIAYIEEEDPSPSIFAGRPGFFYTGVRNWSICTDGIDAIKHTHRPLEECISFLLENKDQMHINTMLNRKITIMSKEGMTLNDDLTIIRYDTI